MLYKRLGANPIGGFAPSLIYQGSERRPAKAPCIGRNERRTKHRAGRQAREGNTDDEAQVHRLRQNQLAVRLPRLLPDLLRSRAAARTSAKAADLRRLQSALHDYANGCALLLGRVQAARISPPRYRKAWVYWKPTFIRNTRGYKKPGFTVEAVHILSIEASKPP